MKKFISKEFLSQGNDEEFGTIASYIKVIDADTETARIDACIRISDCSRSVTLDFDVWRDDDNATLEDRVAKAEALAAHVNEFVRQMKKAANKVKKSQEKYAEK